MATGLALSPLLWAEGTQVPSPLTIQGTTGQPLLTADPPKNIISFPEYDGGPIIPLDPKQLIETPEFQGHHGLFRLQGGDISGGGSSFRWSRQGEPFLLDFLMVNPQFKETRGTGSSEKSIFPGELTAETLYAGVPVDLRGDYPEVADLIVERLALWEDNSPKTIRFIRKVLNNTAIRATRLRSRHLDDRYLPPELNIDRSESVISTASLVIQGYGIYIYASIWDNSLKGTTSRAGLLVHEALRTVKVEISDRLTHKTIQLATAMIMLSSPEEVEAGHLDDLIFGEMWFKDPWQEASEYYLSEVIPGLCQNQNSLIAYYEEMIPKVFGYYEDRPFGEEEWRILQDVDQEVRGFSTNFSGNRFSSLPAFSESPSVEEASPQTLNFWLRIALDGNKVAIRKVISTTNPHTPFYSTLKQHMFFRKQPWMAHVENIKQLAPKVCGQSEGEYDVARDFVMFHDTLIKLITLNLSQSPSYQKVFVRNFGGHIRGISQEVREMAKQVYDEIAEAQICYDPRMKMPTTIHGNIQMAIRLHDLRDCQPVEKIYFPDGQLPKVEPIRLQ